MSLFTVKALSNRSAELMWDPGTVLQNHFMYKYDQRADVIQIFNYMLSSKGFKLVFIFFGVASMLSQLNDGCLDYNLLSVLSAVTVLLV